ncbi:C-C chemokine receptor type 1-like [Saccopteryx leptura]|uniref:C-C chemokine receptor type 1-like n=1 Tax=Saccopteryx leptura TaxID=249018 RepID=UPI00339BC9F4
MEIPTSTMDYDRTTEFDYGDSTPCQKEHLRSFAAQLLPPLYSLVFVTGLVGNILVVLVLLQHKRLKNMTNIYVLNLAIFDLLFLFTLPFWIHHYRTDYWVFGTVTCKLLEGLYYVGLYSEIFFIILLTIDRYLAIVHAVFALRARTVTFGIITSLVVWVLAILVAIPGFYFSESQKEFSRYSCTVYFPHEYHNHWKWFLALKLNILGLVLPLVIMIICYTGIIKILLRRPNERKSKAVRLIFVIMIIFFLFWTPFNLTKFVAAFADVFLDNNCEQNEQLDLAIQVTEVIAYMHCCVNPIIYVFVGERFREYLCQLFHWLLSLSPGKRFLFFHTENQEKASSMSPCTGEQELSDGIRLMRSKSDLPAQGRKSLEVSQVGTQEGTLDTDDSKDKVEGVSRKDSDLNGSCPFPMLMLGLLAQDSGQQRNRQSLWVQVLPNSSSGSQQVDYRLSDVG